MNCPNCGAEIPDNSTFCESCGNAVTAQPATPADGAYQQQPDAQPAPSADFAQQQANAQPAMPATPQAPAAAPVNDSGSIGWGILGFFFPIVGLILFLVWRKNKPKCAKVSGIGAIIGFVLGLLMNVILM